MTDINQADINSSAADVPSQTAPSSNPLPNPAPPDVSSGTPQTPAIPMAPPPTAPSAPAPNQNMSAGIHHSVIGKIFQDIAGGQTTDYVQTPSGPQAVKRDLKPGEMARNILGSAFALMSAGASGARAGHEGRPVQLEPEQSVGNVIHGAEKQREQQAQKVFQNQQSADEATLRAHRDAMEQQKSIQEAVKAEDDHQQHVQELARGSRADDEDAYNNLIKTQQIYQTAMAMPGAEVMKDSDGKEINKLTPREMQDYAINHPEVIHGSTNGSSKYGTIIVKNPVTGSYQIIDYPADRHDTGLANFGQKKDKNGQPMFAADGTPAPDGSVIDPKTKKPTVLTQTVTPQQVQDIQKNNLSIANIQSEMDDREARARRDDSIAKKNDELSEAQDAYNAGDMDKMSPRQKEVMKRYVLIQQNNMSHRELQAAANLAKAGTSNDDTIIAAAQKEYDSAKNDYDDIHDTYNQLAGLTPGIQKGNEIIRQGFAAKPAVIDNGKIITPAIPWAWNGPGGKYEEIGNSGLPDPEIEKARAKVYNALSPAQKASWVDDKGNFSPTIPGQAATPVTKQPVDGDIPDGKSVVYDPQGAPHFIPTKKVDDFLKDPKYKGWSK